MYDYLLLLLYIVIKETVWVSVCFFVCKQQLKKSTKGLDCKNKAKCPHMGPGSIGEMPSVGGLSKGS